MKSLKLRGVLAAAAFAIAAGVSGSASAESVLRVAMTAADIPDWTGAPDQGYEGMRFVGYTMYDALGLWDLSSSDKAATVIPGLATGWDVDPNNNLLWTYHLREGVKFHDDCPWNADSAIWNFARVMDQKAPQFNPRHATQQGSAVVNVASVTKVDDYTIQITTKGPDSFLPNELAMFLMISNCGVEAAGNDYAKFGEHPAGTGPYKFDKLVPHERLELVKNADYWNPDRVPKQDRVVLLPMPEASTRAAALLSGQVDFVEAPSPDTIPTLKGAGMNIILVPYPHNWDYLLKVTSGPFADIRVRQAANMAINRQDMVDMLQGVAIAGYNSLIESQPWYGTPPVYEYDPEGAKKLLEEAGCMPCKIKIGISTSGSGQMQPLPMNELVKEQLDEAGFETELVPMDWNALIGVFFQGAEASGFDGINFSLAPIDAVQGVVKRWMSSFSMPAACCNWGSFKNDKVDELGTTALAEFDEAKRDALLTEMNNTVNAEAPELFIVHDMNPRALSPKLTGFVQAQSWFQDLTPIVVNP